MCSITMAWRPFLVVIVVVIVITFTSSAAAHDDKKVNSDSSTTKKRQPNILVIVADDIGYADVSYQNTNMSIPTKNIDELSKQGIRLNSNYVQSTCTPSRAAMMTGRYASSTGLVFAMLPGSLEGLPATMPTMPQVLRRYDYAAHAVGKWHLGHAKWSQTPVGRGFQTHTGSYMWSMDYHSKELYAEPWAQFGIDWVRAYENGTYTHHAEPRHSTQAITEEALDVMRRHASDTNGEQPLFLYVAFTAAHAPLQPTPEDMTDECRKLPHEWRRHFCGLVQGLDRSVRKLVDGMRSSLGDDCVVVFTSDNGGAPYFGGQNYPLRGAKTTPFEGGVRVPGFVLDTSADGGFLGRGGRTYNELVHISDWLPTLAKLGGASTSDLEALDLDGVDQSRALRTGSDGPRKDVLIEMYYGQRGEFIFPDEDVVAYRKGKYKLIESVNMRDSKYYTEPTSETLATSDSSYAAWIAEWLIEFLEQFTTEGRFDSIRDMIVHVGLHRYYAKMHPFESVALYDLEVDPIEANNLASKLPKVVEELRADTQRLAKRRPRQAKFWMTIDRDKSWLSTLKGGNCSVLQARGIIDPPEHCRFIHPWVDEDADISKIPLVNGAAAWPFIRNVLIQLIKVTWYPFSLATVVTLIARQLLFKNR